MADNSRQAKNAPLDPKVWTIVPGGNTVECRVCIDRVTGRPRVMERRRADIHASSSRHKAQVNKMKLEERMQQQQLPPECEEQQSGEPHPSDCEPATSRDPFEFESIELPASPPQVEDAGFDDPEGLAPLGDLWEVQDQEVEVSPSPCDEPLPEQDEYGDLPPEDEEIVLTASSGFNGEQQGRAKEQNTLVRDNPFYPWPSKAVFLTDLLLSSPRLKFSEAQVEAILRWAKALKAEDVPTKYALDLEEVRASCRVR
ncbi:hypothetical protein BC629DRAFT_1598264 [Irpex lacteus]|nr:hypothetical protein BC629DRAFT_1598264 [Irpex lacteus]